MASTFNAVLGAATALLFWTCIGLCFTRRLVPSLALPLAPAVGWAVYSAATLPLFLVIPFTQATVLVVAGAALAVTAFATACGFVPPARAPSIARCPWWAYVLAALLALAPAAAVFPKFSGDAVSLAAPIYDHVKVAIIGDMTTFGLPPGNPFFADPDHPRLAYYYLWYFAAAQLALATGIGGWEADIAMTWFSAAASLATMMGLAARIGGGAAAVFAVVLSASASVRPVLAAFLTQERVDTVTTGLTGWLFQSSWVPQHLMAATCVLVAVILMGELAARRSILMVVTLALLAAAGFESSTWIGGITFAVAAPVTALVLIGRAGPGRRWHFIAALAAAAVLAAGLAEPLWRDQLAATASRGTPVAARFFPVMDDEIFGGLHGWFDPPAFWLVLLPIELPAVYLIGMIALARLAGARSLDAATRDLVRALGALALTSLGVAWIFVSTIGENDDLGWRAVLPGVMALTVLAAAGVSRWIARPGLAAAACMAVIAVGLAGGFTLIRSYGVARAGAAGPEFAVAPALWAAVRRHAAPDERVGNNPLFLQELTPWPVNISWALLAHRRSCYAGRDATRVYTTLGPRRTDEINAQFIRVFAGIAVPGDIEELAARYGCRVIAVAASDGAWSRDPFAASPFYRLVEERPDRWRIYRSTVEAGP